MTDDDLTTLIVTRAAEIKPEPVTWLWPERLPLGKVTLFAGEGGLGKSMLLLHLAATVSRGGPWPLNEGRSPQGSALILSAEDDAADTVVPRLIAAGADLAKVHLVTAVIGDEGRRMFSLQADLERLDAEIARHEDVLLVVIDPVTSYLGPVDSHKNAELRAVLEPMGAMAARRGVAVACNTHLSKAQSGSANSRVLGSVGFVNHARAVFIVAADPDDRSRRLVIPSKLNVGRQREGLAYRIEDKPISDGIRAPYVAWERKAVTISADDALSALAGDSEARSARDEAEAFLLEILGTGPVPQKEIRTAAQGYGLSYRTVQRAKADLRIEARRVAVGDHAYWTWNLPKNASQGTKDATQKHGALGALGALDDCKDAKDAKDANFTGGTLNGNDGGLDDAGEIDLAIPAFLDRRRND